MFTSCHNRNGLFVRLRVDGVLARARAHFRVSARSQSSPGFKVLAKLDIAEHRRAAGRAHHPADEVPAARSTSAFPSCRRSRAKGAILRLLDKGARSRRH